MSWECERCHFDANRDDDPQCQACLRMRMPRTIILVDLASGREQRTNLATPVGRRLLQKIADDAHYASEPQFQLLRDESAGAWLIHHNSTAVNPTYYNGRALDSNAQPIDSGGSISIGPERLQLIVRFQF